MTDDSTDHYPTEQDLIAGVEALKATEGRLEPDPEPGTLTTAHAEYLASQAVDVELAQSLGVRSLTSPEDLAGLGDDWSSWRNFPAIVFPWTSPDGRVEYQARPDNPTTDSKGKLRKYVFRRDMTPVLWAVSTSSRSDGLVVIAEGTKQCLAAASYAPAGTSVFGIAGCRMWQVDGVPIADLGVVDGREVVVILDADAAGNLDVYSAGVGLAQALAIEGAGPVRFARVPGGKTTGLDDVLAARAPERRADYLARLLDNAKTKPADAKPKPKKRKETVPENTDRPTLIVNRDRLEVINELSSALIDRWDGRELFNHGGVISRRKGHVMVPVDRGANRNLIQETVVTVNENETSNGTTYDFTWPDANTIDAVMSRAEKFSPLERVSRAPFVRPDGSIAATTGYDEATRTMLVPDDEVAGVEVPEHPTAEEVEKARELIMGDWLGDFPFETDADRANALALVVTPAVRSLVPRVPLAVVDGLQMGVGKNLLADSILTVYTGEPARPMNFVDEKEELRKQITSAFRTGSEFFVFDEAHTIEGAALAQALTATTWQDRILGVSTMAEFPNRVTWMSLGNQVQVRGDLTRRVYRVALRPNYDNPQDRKASSFRHPGQSGLDLGSWTRKNRRELLTAVLTLVRAWFSKGCPVPSRGISFGSFEAWERTVGGIVETAGLPGFLSNLTVWRSESDFDSQYWTQHLSWLFDQFGTEPFRGSDVKTKAQADPAGYLSPPRLDDPGDKGYAKSLGEAYYRLRGRRYEGFRIVSAGGGRGKVTRWQVTKDDAGPVPQQPGPVPQQPGPVPQQTEPDPVDPDPQPTTDQVPDSPNLAEPDPQPTTPEPEPDQVSAELVTFDIETDDATELHHGNPYFVRLSGWAYDDRPVEPLAEFDPGRTVEALRAHTGRAGHITGHNIMAFDIPALVRSGHLDMAEVHQWAAEGRLFDALLAARHVDPPMARDKGVSADRKYDLDTLGRGLDLGHKMGDLNALAKKFGGYSEIPTDDPEYREYLVGDVELSRKLYHHLLVEVMKMGPAGWTYLEREHRVAALGAQISYNGFRVNVPELARRVEDVERRKVEALDMLHTKYGIPLADAKGKRYASPLATNAGKQALTDALTRAGATSLWTTPASGQISTNGDHMKHLVQEYHHLPGVREIAKAVFRIVGARTVYETITKNLIGDRVHPKIGFDQATGRWSLTSPGLTVMGKRGGRHVEREVFLPEPGHVVIAADLSQVDMRAVAGLSQDLAYIEMLRNDDPHAEIARALFGTVKKRDEAKGIGHGWNYGRGLKAISESQDIDPALVRQFDQSMRERFPRLVEWQGEVRAIAESGQLLDNGWGRKMRPDPRRAHTQGPALMGQGAARDIMMEGLLRMPAELLPYLRAQVHDEIVLSVPEDRAEEIGGAVVDALTFEWKGVPIKADVSRPGANWGDVYGK